MRGYCAERWSGSCICVSGVSFSSFSRVCRVEGPALAQSVYSLLVAGAGDAVYMAPEARKKICGGSYRFLNVRPARRIALWICGLRVLPAAARRVSLVIRLRKLISCYATAG